MRYYDKFLDNSLDRMNGKSVAVIPGTVLERVTPENVDESEVPEQIANVIIKEVSFYRNIVNPKIKETFTRLQNRLEGVKKEALSTGANIVAVGIPEKVEEDFSFNDDEYMEYSDINLNSLDADAIREIAGDNKYFDFISDAKLMSVWEKYFMVFSTDNTLIQSMFTLSSLTADNVDDIFISYYILKGMMGKDYVDGTGNIGEFRENRKKYFNMVKRMISTRIERLKSSIRKEVIVLKVETRTNTVVIVKDLYKPFVKAGGTPDMLYGLLSAEKGLITVNDIIADKLELEEAYKKKARNNMAKVNSRITQNTSDGLLALITYMVKECPKDEINEKYDAIAMYIKSVELSELASPITMIENIFSDIIYKNSNLKTFLRLFRVHSENSTVKLAVTLTISDMIATYLVNSIEVTEA